jgi:hypothetical protein
VIQHGLIKTSADRFTNADEYIARLDGVIASARLGTAPIVQHHIPEALGSAPTAMQQTYTPPPGTLSPLTPAPVDNDGTMILLTERKSAPALPSPTHAISLAEAPPIPRNYYRIGLYVLGACAVIAIITAIASGGGKSDSAPSPKQPETKSEPPVPQIKAPSMGDLTVDKETRLKALLHDLETGKTCTDRKAAIPGLVMLGDERAIKALKAARYRMRGGVLGFSQSNANSCLKSDAEAAIKELGGSLK